MTTVSQKNGSYVIIIEEPTKQELAVIGHLQRIEEGALSEWDYWSLGPPRPSKTSPMDEAFSVKPKKSENGKKEDLKRLFEEEVPFGNEGNEYTGKTVNKEAKNKPTIDEAEKPNARKGSFIPGRNDSLFKL